MALEIASLNERLTWGAMVTGLTPADLDRSDVSRGTRNRAAFSMGAHMCIGQHFARVEMATALNLLLDRLHRLRLDPESIRVRFD